MDPAFAKQKAKKAHRATSTAASINECAAIHGAPASKRHPLGFCRAAFSTCSTFILRRDRNENEAERSERNDYLRFPFIQWRPSWHDFE
jgi:hypothetical protein